MKIDFKDYSYKDFFVMVDVASPISKLIETNSKNYNYVVNRRVHEKDSISDIYDGKRYREFVNSLNESDRHSYASTVFNTNGAPLFKSSAYSILPIFLMLNEVEYHVRSKELILAVLWFGKDNNLLQRCLAIKIKLDCYLNILFHKLTHIWLILMHLIKLWY